jgi:hypothetical protein
MSELVLLDNDVILKTSCYGLVEETRGLLSEEDGCLGGLGLARFVLGKRVQKSRNIKHRDKTAFALQTFLASIDALEPDAEELALAASFEEKAQMLGAALDTGESQLLAILIRRCARSLATGDKRAIAAIHTIASELPLIAEAEGRLQCLEQLMLELLSRNDVSLLAEKVCTEPDVDKTLSICFGCSSQKTDTETTREGLKSYVGYLRKRSGKLLVSAH